MTQPNPPGKDLVTPDNTVGGRIIAARINDYRYVLPSFLNAEFFVAAARSMLRMNRDLRDVAQKNPESLFDALMKCARLGHTPGDGRYDLAAFGDEIVGIERYQGAVDRMFRSGNVKTVQAEVIREHDVYLKPQPAEGRFLPIHEFDEFADERTRGPLKGAYAYAQLSDGAWSRVVFMNRQTIMKHKAEAKTKKFWEGKWEEDMWLKTVVLKLKSWVPISADYRREQIQLAHTALTHPDDRINMLADESGAEDDREPITATVVNP